MPPSSAHAKQIPQLTQHNHTSDKYTQRDSDDAEAEYLPTYFKDAGGKQDRVTSLVGREAAIIREGGGILHTRCEC